MEKEDLVLFDTDYIVRGDQHVPRNVHVIFGSLNYEYLHFGFSFIKYGWTFVSFFELEIFLAITPEKTGTTWQLILSLFYFC